MEKAQENVERVALLSRLELSDEEKRKITPQFEEIVKFVEKINELDTEGIEPTYHVVDVKNVRRKDEIKKSMDVSTIAELAPESEYDHISVPQVIE